MDSIDKVPDEQLKGHNLGMIEVINSTTQYRFDLSFEFQMTFIAQTSAYYRSCLQLIMCGTRFFFLLKIIFLTPKYNLSDVNKISVQLNE